MKEGRSGWDGQSKFIDMIKLFRRIRQKLLTEKLPGRPAGRYLLYAIGEIVLVVIGILIALQINTWNENKKQRLEERRILINLQADLVQDTMELNKKH